MAKPSLRKRHKWCNPRAGNIRACGPQFDFIGGTLLESFPEFLSDGVGLWLKADVETIASTGVWQDQSGSVPPNDATNGTPANRPVSQASILNGLPGVFFDGLLKSLTTPVFSAAYTEGEFFALIRRVADPGPGFPSNGIWDFSTSIDAEHLPFADGNWYSEVGSTVRRNTGNPVASLTSPTLINVVSTPTEWTARINNILHFTTPTNTVGFPAVGCEIGRSFSGALGLTYYEGWFFEIVLKPYKFTAQQRNDFIAYINDKWGTSF